MKTLKPMPHQVKGISALTVEGDTRAWVAMACGTGKTLVGRHAAYQRARKGGVILVFAPSKRLTREHLTSWTRDTPGGVESLLVYSDPDGVTDPDRIARFLRDPGSGKPRIIFSTYQSAPRIHDAYRLHADLPPVAVMLMDEAHVTASMTGDGYGLVLSDQFIPASARLAMTATPRVHIDPESGTDTVVSMDDPALYGECRYELSFHQAIDDRLISDFRVIVITVTDAEIHRLLDGVAEAEDLPSSVLASQVAMVHAVKELGLSSALAFHNRVDRSRAYTRTLGEIARKMGCGPLEALHMDGKTRPAERDRMLAKLAKPRPGSAVVLSSVNTISVGVDVPQVEAVQFADPRASRVAVAQAVGRALRRPPEKVGVEQPDEGAETAKVILPVYLPPGQDAEEILMASRFGAVWSVLAALRDFDGRLDSELAKKVMKSARQKAELPERLEIQQTGMDALPAGVASRLSGALEAHLMTLGNRRPRHPAVSRENLTRLQREWIRVHGGHRDDPRWADLLYEVACGFRDAVGDNPANRHVPSAFLPYVGAAFDFARRYEARRAQPEE